MPQKFDLQPFQPVQPYDIGGGGLDLQPFGQPEKQYEDEPSILGGWWDKFREWDAPILDVTPYTNKMGKFIEDYTPNAVSSAALSMLPFGSGNMLQSMLRPGVDKPSDLVGGMVRSAGDVTSGLSSPSNIAAMAASGGAYGAARAGLPLAARGLTYLARGTSLPAVVSGGERLGGEFTGEEPINWGNVGLGMGELAGGLAGSFEPIPRVHTPTPVPAPPVRPPYRPGGIGPTEQMRLPFDQPLPPPPPPPPPEYTQPRLPFEEPTQMDLGLPEPAPFEGPEGQFQLPLYEMRAGNRFSEVPPNQQIDLSMPEPPKEAGLPRIIARKDWTPALIEEYTQQGYVRGGVTPEGVPYMILADEAAPITRTEPTPVQEPDEVTFNEDEGFTIPKAQASTAVIQRLREQGFEQVGIDERGGSIFRKMEDFEPQEMRVPGVREGKGGLENVAMGGADPRVLDVLGTSLYSRSAPIVTTKELLQNAFDEHKIAGVNEPVRVLIDGGAPNPTVKGGELGKSITVRDRGRGLMPDQIYTVLSDMGKTGKAGVESAAGGFGFAKAAPFLGGKHATIISVVDTPQGRMKYTFRGSPTELKNQVKGVPLNVEKVGKEVPTGLEITTWYNQGVTGFYEAAEWAQGMTERSSGLASGIKLVDTYNATPVSARRWLDETPQNPIKPEEYNYLAQGAKSFTSQAMPPMVDTITTPGAKINLHYETIPDLETSEYKLHMMNKGMYQGSKEGSYGDPTANVPSNIVADIIALVEEGQDAYPFSANREQIHTDVTKAINTWVNDNIVSGVQKKRVAAIQRKYDAIAPLNDRALDHDVHFYDDGARLNPDELDAISNHPELNKALSALEAVHLEMLGIADSLGWSSEVMGAKFTKPSERLKKFGLLLQAPDARGNLTLGIHIPRPDDMDNSAILINLFEQLNRASKQANPIDALTTELFTTLAHEQAHIPGGTHDKKFAYRDADLRARFGQLNTGEWLDALGAAFDDGTGRIKPEISDILSVYNGSRQRPARADSAVLASGISSTGRSDTGARTRGDAGGIDTGEAESSTVKKKDKIRSIVREAYNLPRAATTTLDLSAPLRQGLPLIFTKEWLGSWRQMLAAGFKGEEVYKKTLSDIRARPDFQRKIDRNTGKVRKSFAEEAGIELTDVNSKLSNREEAVASNWIETGGMFGKSNAVQGAYQKTLGRAARASNRAYTAFLNQLRADTFESLIKDATRDFEAGTKGARNPRTDIVFAKEIADFVNTATGRGPLRVARPTISEGRLGLKESNFERAAKGLTDTIFSPRLMASRVRMLNPMTYMMASPFVRKQYTKSLLSVAAAWGTMSALAAGLGADVSLDPNSADFGKIRVGETRLDPAGGFQQYLVAASRLISGRTTSSATGRDFELGQGYRADTRKDIAERFAANKLHPVMKFAYDIWNASERQPFHVADRSLQMFIPLIVQDVLELAKEDPSLLPLMLPVVAGMGTQTYGKGESVGKIIPPENDWLIQGGSPYWPE